MKNKNQSNPFVSQRITSLLKENFDNKEMKMLTPKRQFKFSNPLKYGKVMSQNEETSRKEIANQSYCSKNAYWEKRETSTKEKLQKIKTLHENEENLLMRDRPLLSRNSQLIVKRLKSASIDKTPDQTKNKNKKMVLSKKTVDELYEQKMNKIESIPIQSLLNNNELIIDDQEKNDNINFQQSNISDTDTEIDKIKKATKSLVKISIPYQTDIRQPIKALTIDNETQNNQSILKNEWQSKLPKDDVSDNNASLKLIRQHLFDYYNDKQISLHAVIQKPNLNNYDQQQNGFKFNNQYIFDNMNYNNNQLNNLENQVIYNINCSQQLKRYNPILQFREENNKRMNDLKQLKSFSDNAFCLHQQENNIYNNTMKMLQEEQFQTNQTDQMRKSLIQNEYSSLSKNINYLNEKMKYNEKQKEFIESQFNNQHNPHSKPQLTDIIQQNHEYPSLFDDNLNINLSLCKCMYQ